MDGGGQVIRPAIPNDIQRLVEMGYAYFVDAGWEKHATFDIESFAFTCGVLLDSNGVLLVGEKEGRAVGMIGTGLVPFVWNRNIQAAVEIFWYCEPPHRRKIGAALLAANEAALRKRGVHIASMSSEEGRKEANLGQFYVHKGYVPVERTYWKVL
jgi:GNAT superfamily N-acetyltransferase